MAGKAGRTDMCVGIPMQVIEGDELSALCEDRRGRRRVNMQMVGVQNPGTWILNFHGVAREVLSEQSARDIDNALRAIEAALAGETDLDRFFPGLVGRTPGRFL